MLKLQQVGKTYTSGGGEFVALHGIDLHVGRHEFVALTGSSGSGKSTLMNILGCLDTPSCGTYELDGIDVGSMDGEALAGVRNRRIGFVFQAFHLVPRMSAIDNVAHPLVYRGVPRIERLERAAAARESVGLASKRTSRPNELSGGQRQRVAIARALVTQPGIILADEPTGNLDSRTSHEIMALFGQLHADGATIALVTHEPDVAARCRRVVRLHDGRIAEDFIQSSRDCAA
jgi:putative ABC transport system ATP-binding protein